MGKIHTAQSISVHVRRTDYIGSYYAGICDKEYYEKAFNFIQEKIDSPTFFIFSDDIERCKKEFLLNKVYFIDWNIKQNSYKDMILMSLCKHNIIANSTFSWR